MAIIPTYLANHIIDPILTQTKGHIRINIIPISRFAGVEVPPSYAFFGSPKNGRGLPMKPSVMIVKTMFLEKLLF
jgi:hypothetical protein